MQALALLLLAMAVLPAVYARDARRQRKQRAKFFDDVPGLFDSYRITQQGSHYPVLTGRYRGMRVRLEPVLDDMAWRKLPSLWLKATLLVPDPARGTLDFLVRPQGIEFYSPSSDLPEQIPVPQDWPQHALLATDDRATMPSLAGLTPHIALFEDPRMKELLITPRGVRLVYQAAQGERAEYLVLRQSRFKQSVFDAAIAARLLDALIAIAATLDKEQELNRTEAA